MNELTREQFLSGAVFTFKGDKYTRYKFVKGKENDCEAGYLQEITGNTYISTCHDGNVSKVNKAGFKIYTTLAGKSVQGWRYFRDFVIVEPKP